MHKNKTPDTDVEISKFLSYILRHKPEAIGLCLDSEGWAQIDTLLRLATAHGNPISHEQCMRVVAQSDKKRFTLSADGLCIRAAQGHSTGHVSISYAPQTPPEMLFHGTAERFGESIRAKGLVPGQRQYVHLSPDRQTAVAVGRRHGKPLVLTIQAGKMAKDGYAFYLAENGVWLTREVPVAYLACE